VDLRAKRLSGTRWLVLLIVVLGTMVLSPARAAADSPGLASADDQVVRVGTEGTYPPFTYKDPRTNQLTGYDIEVIEAVAEESDWTLQAVQSDFDAIFPALDADRIDVIANQVSINPEREARYIFSEPYTYSRGVIVTRSDVDDITTLADLEGKTTAQSETSNWAQVARDAGAKVQSVEGFAQAANLLVQGRVDAIVNDNIAVLDYLASTGSKDVKIAGNAGDEVSRQALTFRKTDTALRDQANEALASLRKSGELRRISEKYFKADVSVEKGGDVELEGSDKGRSTWEVVRSTTGPMLVGIIKGTIPLTIIAFGCGLLLALLAALARLSRIPVVDLPARAYISVIRGTPLLVQLFIVFYGLPEVGIKMPGFLGACIVLSLNVGGYAAEIIRASILSVPRGQFEAATTIGMPYWLTMRRIVLPQALRIAVPPLSNTLLSLVKDTSLVSVVLVTDMFRVARDAASLSTRYLALYSLAALFYWVICLVLSLAQRRLERRLERFAV
jgi:cystine transport system permease protein